MSVFSIDPAEGTPVTTDAVKSVCADLGVTIKDDELDDYRRLLGVFHESAEAIMSTPDYVPFTDTERFPRENVHFPSAEDNEYRAWAWKCTIKDKTAKSKGGLLEGKTLALKDMIAVKDVPMLCGTDMFTGFVPNLDATVVTRILEAGGEVVGKAVCENLCHSGTSHSAATGPVENPFVKGYSSGGSSSGSGVLVALGEVWGSIGADQGGSVRIPACNCGIVGLKPTWGLIPYTGCGSNEPTNDHLGPMTKTVMDNAILLQAIAGNDNIDDRSFCAPPPDHIPQYGSSLAETEDPGNLTGFKIGIVTESLQSAVLDPRVRETFLRAADGFRMLGAQVSEVSIPHHKSASTIWTGISKVGGYLAKKSGPFGRRGHQMVELNQNMWPLRDEQWQKAYVSTKNIYLNGAYAARQFPHLIAKSTNLSRQLRDAYDAALKEFDVLIMPTLPYVATSHCLDGGPIEQIAKQIGLTSNTCPFNQTGHPALTMPIGMLAVEEGPESGSGKKLPVGIQIVGRWWSEETIYRCAYAWEISNDWELM